MGRTCELVVGWEETQRLVVLQVGVSRQSGTQSRSSWLGYLYCLDESRKLTRLDPGEECGISGWMARLDMAKERPVDCGR